LKEKCTDTVDTDPTDYRAPPKVEPVMYRGQKNYQFHTIITCKVQIAERRKTATIKKKKTTVDMFVGISGRPCHSPFSNTPSLTLAINW
jgi:hypothetical protein